MKFNLSKMPAACKSPLKLGTVYAARGGRADSAPLFWVLVALPKDSAVLLGIDRDGEIISATKYGQHAIVRWPVVGYCKDVESMVLNMQMLTGEKA
jgi:hypothetical protein